MDPVRLARLSPEEKRALLARLLASRTDRAAVVDEYRAPAQAPGIGDAPLRPAPRTASLPMSYGQETLWFLDQLEPGNACYNCPAALRITGKLDETALRRAFEMIVHRHESLRSTFGVERDRRVVFVNPPADLPFQIADVRHVPLGEREQRASQLIDAESRKPFDLARGPMLRLGLVRVTDDDSIVLMTVHHIAFDGWSTGVLLHEFATLYKAIVGGRPAGLPAPKIQYPDYAYWQRRWQQDGLLDAQLAYWKQQLQGVPPLLNLPTDRPRPQVWTFRGAALPLQFPPAMVAGLRALGQREGCTLFMTMLSAFQTLLYRWSGQDDICIGSPIANRNRVETEGLIGFVVNTLVLRGNLRGNPTFLELMQRTRETALAAYAHQDLPFERLMQALHPLRDVRHSSLFQVLFVLQNAPIHIPALPGLSAKLLLDQHNGTAKFDLTLGLTDMPEGLAGTLEYNTDLFDASTMERLAGQFHRLLSEVIQDAHRPLSDLPLLDPKERDRLLEIGEGIKIDGHPDRCFHRLFEARAAAHPDATALTCDEATVTYAVLNERANRLARYLRRRGVGPEDTVGICTEKSVETLVGLLAVMKAGGAYVPLDPALPRERLSIVLADAKPLLVLVQERLAADVPFDADRVLCLDVIPAPWSGESPINLPGGAGPRDLAYVIYTSGTTGVPKGCMIEHHSLVNAFDGWEVAYGLSKLPSYLQMANFAFDVFTGDFVRALGAGGRLVLCPTDTLVDPEKLLDLIRRERIAFAEFVPAVVRPFLRYLEATGQTLEPVQLVVCGSDVWYGGEFRRLRRVLGPHARLINSYGLTEATIDNVYYDGGDEALVDDVSIPIGRPYANQRAIVLDSRLSLQPVGVPGELHVGGAALARGYLNRPDLTGEKFITDPFHPGERLYKTGDLARVLANGLIEHLGRSDDQVKVRGFRIELGEIETALAQHPAVKECAVAARDDGRGSKRLVAYVVLLDEHNTTLSMELRGFLASKLPEYMVPAAFMPLGALPLSPNGKVDRRALPAPDPGRTELSAEYVPPQTPTEERLAAIWASALQVDRVGAHDNFFELGGHSLMATQVVSRVQGEFGVHVALRKLFEASTLAAFAAAIDAAVQAMDRERLRPAARAGAVPLTLAQQRLWFLDQFEPGNPAHHVSTAVRMTGALDAAVWRRGFEAIVARNNLLRTSFPRVDGLPTSSIAPSLKLEMVEVDLGNLAIDEREAKARSLGVEQYQQPFDLARGPLCRATLVSLSPKDHVLLVTMHQIIADQASVTAFVHQLAAIYGHLAAGNVSPLPPLSAQFADFAQWQQQWLEGANSAGQLAYWTEQLTGAPPVLDLPTDRPRSATKSFRGTARPHVLSPAISDALRAFAGQRGVSLSAVYLAAYQALLARCSGQEDIVVGLRVPNRHRLNVENALGHFANTLPIRADLSAELSFSEFVDRTQNVFARALAHQDLPCEYLAEKLGQRFDPSRPSIFQVTFAHEEAQSTVQVLGLTLSPMPIDYGTSANDLSLTIRDGAETIAIAEFDSELFDEATIAGFLRHFETLLGRLVAEPDRCDRLPDFMLPSAIVGLSELPVTVGGKVDRRALRAVGIPQAQKFVAPRTPTEQQVGAIWAAQFGTERISVEADFFEVGGTPSIAMQLAARLSRALGREIMARTIVRYPTVAGLAGAVDAGAMAPVQRDDSTSSPVVATRSWLDDLGPHVQLERRPLGELVAAKTLPPVQAAAIGYLPSSLLHFTGLSADEITRHWFGNRPVVSNVSELDLGRIATVLIPRFDTQLYQDPNDMLALLSEGLRIARDLGAGTVSLTGLLPSATDYGRSLMQATAHQDLPQVTTGHATTTATVVLAIRRILAETGRGLARERVAFVGLGSIGTAVLRLMLRCLPHPAEIRLCDVYSKRDALLALRREVIAHGYRGPVHVSEARGAVPTEMYQATLFIGATNVPDILDVDLLPPGALVVDDSAPHCFRPDAAICRLREHGDILFTEGGTLKAPKPIRQIVHLPVEMETLARLLPRDMLPIQDHHQITGCVVSSLLSTRYPHLRPTIGLVDGPTSHEHFNKLTELAFDAAQLHCEGFVVETAAVASFRERYGVVDADTRPAQSAAAPIRAPIKNWANGRSDRRSTRRRTHGTK